MLWRPALPTRREHRARGAGGGGQQTLKGHLLAGEGERLFPGLPKPTEANDSTGSQFRGSRWANPSANDQAGLAQ